jgi:hypothetical protein
MGGRGSGSPYYHWWRSPKKRVVEDCRHLDANRWTRERILQAGVQHSGSWCWYRDASKMELASSIGYEVCTLDLDDSWVRLWYTDTQTQAKVDYRILLETTRPRFGGLRWWFLCPLSVNGVYCGRRVAKLYLDGRYFGCRHCHRLTYTSCQESHKYDRAYRFLAKDTGFDVETVKWALDCIGKRY